ncbi:hypothetical protein BV372_22965 [Nostoc sp. T09]|nr:hypothetical protein BV372_22965 [Nostoc sp. T09]
MSRKVILRSIVSLGLLFGVASSTAVAQMTHEMPASEKSSRTEFQPIEQPLAIKGAVTVGGLALIGLELWWFLLSKPKSQTAQANNGIQEVSITVDGGYEPSRVVVNANQPVRLNFLRRDSSSCLAEIKLPDFHIAQDLPLNKVTAIEFTPGNPGTYTFTCGMNMFRGVIEVQSAELSEERQMAVPMKKFDRQG